MKAHIYLIGAVCCLIGLMYACQNNGAQDVCNDELLGQSTQGNLTFRPIHAVVAFPHAGFSVGVLVDDPSGDHTNLEVWKANGDHRLLEEKVGSNLLAVTPGGRLFYRRSVDVFKRSFSSITATGIDRQDHLAPAVVPAAFVGPPSDSLLYIWGTNGTLVAYDYRLEQEQVITNSSRNVVSYSPSMRRLLVVEDKWLLAKKYSTGQLDTLGHLNELGNSRQFTGQPVWLETTLSLWVSTDRGLFRYTWNDDTWHTLLSFCPQDRIVVQRAGSSRRIAGFQYEREFDNGSYTEVQYPITLTYEDKTGNLQVQVVERKE